MTVAIVGAGWAGLAAAVELTRRGVPVVVLEAARELGGRARAVTGNEESVDNGQHILLGAYRQVLGLLKTIGMPEASVLRRLPLTLQLHGKDGDRVALRTGPLPAPGHLLWGLMSCAGLAWPDRWQALRFASRVQRGDDVLHEHDRVLADHLRACGQGRRVIRALWEPLCLAALNTPLSEASANLFVGVMRAAFFGHRADSDLLLPVRDLSRCFPAPARAYVESRGGVVRPGVRTLALEVEASRVRAVLTAEERLEVDRVIVATGPRACVRLLSPHRELASVAAQCVRLEGSPICTIYLRYPSTVTLGQDFIGILDGVAQWLFDRGRLIGTPGLMAAVISGAGPHMQWDNERLIATVTQDIAARFPTWPRPEAAWAIREKQATFAATAGVDRYRPAQRTAVRGLWLAGDYTRTPYPGTLESAAWSGVECARLITNESEHSDAVLSTHA